MANNRSLESIKLRLARSNEKNAVLTFFDGLLFDKQIEQLLLAFNGMETGKFSTGEHILVLEKNHKEVIGAVIFDKSEIYAVRVISSEKKEYEKLLVSAVAKFAQEHAYCKKHIILSSKQTNQPLWEYFDFHSLCDYFDANISCVDEDYLHILKAIKTELFVESHNKPSLETENIYKRYKIEIESELKTKEKEKNLNQVLFQLSSYLTFNTKQEASSKVAASLVNYSKEHCNHEEKMSFFILIEKEFIKPLYQKNHLVQNKISHLKKEIARCYSSNIIFTGKSALYLTGQDIINLTKNNMMPTFVLGPKHFYYIGNKNSIKFSDKIADNKSHKKLIANLKQYFIKNNLQETVCVILPMYLQEMIEKETGIQIPTHNWKDVLCDSYYHARSSTRFIHYHTNQSEEERFTMQSSDISNAISGSTFKSNDTAINIESHVLDASFSARTYKDGVITVSDAVAGNFGDEHQDKNLSDVAYFICKHASRLLSTAEYRNPESLKKSMPMIIKMLSQEADIKGKKFGSQATLGCGRLYVAEDNCRFVGFNIGNTMLIAYDPDTRTFMTIAKPKALLTINPDGTGGKVGPAFFPNPLESDIQIIDVIVPKNSIVLGLTNGAYDYLPCITTNQAISGLNCFYQEKEINFQQLTELLPLNFIEEAEDFESILQVGLLLAGREQLNIEWKVLQSKIPNDQAKKIIEETLHQQKCKIDAAENEIKKLDSDIKNLENEIQALSLKKPLDSKITQKNSEKQSLIKLRKHSCDYAGEIAKSYMKELNRYKAKYKIKIGDDVTIISISAKKIRKMSCDKKNTVTIKTQTHLFLSQGFFPSLQQDTKAKNFPIENNVNQSIFLLKKGH